MIAGFNLLNNSISGFHRQNQRTGADLQNWPRVLRSERTSERFEIRKESRFGGFRLRPPRRRGSSGKVGTALEVDLHRFEAGLLEAVHLKSDRKSNLNHLTKLNTYVVSQYKC